MEELHMCRLCPRACGVNRLAGQRGFCGADGRVIVARAAKHFWEEPPISGKNGSGTVFFGHCTLGCVFCQNRQISRRESTGKEVSIERLAEIFCELQVQGAHNINLVTGTHYVPQIVLALQLAKARGLSIPIVWNSGGYETRGTLLMLEGLVNVYLPDFKYYSSYYSEKYSNAPDYADCAREAIDEMLRQVGKPCYSADGLLTRGVVIRHLMLPTLAGDTAQVLRCIAEKWGEDVLVSLMRQYTPFGMEAYSELNRTITDAEYREAVELYQMLGICGFLQEGEAIGESFIPAFNGEGV